MFKRITLQAIAKKIGQHDPRTLSREVAFLTVYGASEWLADQALRQGRITEVEQPSNAQLRKLSAKLFPQA